MNNSGRRLCAQRRCEADFPTLIIINVNIILNPLFPAAGSLYCFCFEDEFLWGKFKCVMVTSDGKVAHEVAWWISVVSTHQELL